MLAPQRVMEIALQTNYKIPSRIRKQYSELLVARAVRFYIENQLDSPVVQEDLYNGEDFDCDCSRENAEKGKHEDNCEFVQNPYPNLSYNLERERDWQIEQKQYLK